MQVEAKSMQKKTCEWITNWSTAGPKMQHAVAFNQSQPIVFSCSHCQRTMLFRKITFPSAIYFEEFTKRNRFLFGCFQKRNSCRLIRRLYIYKTRQDDIKAAALVKCKTFFVLLKPAGDAFGHFIEPPW